MQLQCRIPSAIQTFFLEKIKNKTADKAKLQKKQSEKLKNLLIYTRRAKEETKTKPVKQRKQTVIFHFGVEVPHF